MTNSKRICGITAALMTVSLMAGLWGCGEETALVAHREQRGRYTVVWLHGTPYEMGQQHARLLKQELKAGLKAIDEDFVLKAMFVMADHLGLVDLARKSSYPDMLEECRGMAEESKDIGWTEEHCLVLNFGDVVAEQVQYGKPKNTDIAPGCSQVVASGKATADGRLLHARILDWSQIDFIINYPVIFVRRPAGKLGHAVIGFPGNLSPYQGINEAGISVASNEITPRDNTVTDSTGRSHVQLVGEILARARTLEQARTMARKVNSMSMELIVVADGNAGQAEVFELAPAAMEARPMKDGVVYATNHFVGAKTAPLDRDPIKQDSTLRLQRLEQLVQAGGSATLHGKLSPGALVQLMRDRVDPQTKVASKVETFDDGKSLATNGALFQLVFDPRALNFWVAAGALPVPAQPYTGFSLGQLLGLEGHAGASPAQIP